MSAFDLTETGLANGVWEGVITRLEGEGESGAPEIDVRHMDGPVQSEIQETGDGRWLLKVPVPSEAIADGVHVFVIYDQNSDEKLGDFTLLAGEPVADDIRAEIALLRAELDMLKRAFRRHCLETT